MRQRLDFATDGAHWPHRDLSRFVTAAGLRWHVQHAPHPDPDAPTVLLLHGTGASTHSWRELIPLLQPQVAVLALDLPGHGFSAMPDASAVPELCSLPGMARGVAALLQTLSITPATVVGHSAGAALACRMALDGLLAPARLVSVNGALLPLDGWAGQFFSPMAKLLAKAPLVPELFSWRAAQADVLQKLLDGTGSRLDGEGQALYRPKWPTAWPPCCASKVRARCWSWTAWATWPTKSSPALLRPWCLPCQPETGLCGWAQALFHPLKTPICCATRAQMHAFSGLGPQIFIGVFPRFRA